ncbi:MAG: tautomerase family protein [Actinobacteria bacterium]|nr:tautomerase family protein [Actinomycetota bacterium]
MPYINVRLMEDVLTPEQKQTIAEGITETLVRVIGEPIRGATWVLIDDIRSGQLVIGGDALTTDGVKQLLGSVPAAV